MTGYQCPLLIVPDRLLWRLGGLFLRLGLGGSHDFGGFLGAGLPTLD
jgi:hypothetical protein